MVDERLKFVLFSLVFVIGIDHRVFLIIICIWFYAERPKDSEARIRDSVYKFCLNFCGSLFMNEMGFFSLYLVVL